MDIVNLYKTHKEHFDILKEENKHLILPMQHNLNVMKFAKRSKFPDIQFDEYIGLRPAGEFFSYDRPNVWVFIANNKSEFKKLNARHIHHGFYITITNTDDGGLYADWNEPLNEVDLQKVLDYFNLLAIDGLDSAEETVKDIEGLIGKSKYYDFS